MSDLFYSAVVVILFGMAILLAIRGLTAIAAKGGKKAFSQDGANKKSNILEEFLVFAIFFAYWEVFAMFVFHDEGYFSWTIALLATYLTSIPYRLVKQSISRRK